MSKSAMPNPERFAAAIQRAVEQHQPAEPKITLKSLVGRYYKQLQVARMASVSWKEIAQHLTNEGFIISSHTLANYYNQYRHTLKAAQQKSNSTQLSQSLEHGKASGNATASGRATAPKQSKGKRT